MANYIGFTRTNYFAVNDQDAFRKAIADCRTSEGGLQIFETTVNGQKLFGFGCYGTISGIPPADGKDDCEEDMDAFYDALQSVLADGHAIMITEIGYEKLRYLIGECIIITSSDISSVFLRDTALQKAREMLNDPKYAPKMEY